MVSNVADRSRRVTTVTSPLSRTCRMSFIILSRAVSVLCPGLQADWEIGKRLLALRYAESCERTTFSVTFDKKRKIGDGPVVFQTVRVKRWLFQKWFYNGLYKDEGKTPVCRD